MDEREVPVSRIPCETMPLVSIAAYNEAQNTMIHVDRTADFHVLIYILKGSMEIIEEEATHTLKAGSLFFLKANVHHWGVKPYELGTSWYYIHFYASEPEGDLKPLELKQTYELSKLFEVNLMLWKIFLHCYELSYYKEEQSSGHKHVRKAIQFLEENYNRQFTVNEMEHTLGLSYKYLGTLLKKETKMTIKEYQQMLRMKEAERLLCFTDLSVTEIADKVGYGDVFYFSNVFKRTKGVSPMKFRNMYIPYI